MWLGDEDLEPDDGTPVPIEQPTTIVTKPLSEKDQDDRVRMALGLTHDDPLPDVSRKTLLAYHRYLKDRSEVPVQGPVRGRRLVADRPPAASIPRSTTWTRKKGCSARPGAVRGRSTCRCPNSTRPAPATASWSGIMATGSATIAEAEGETMAKKKPKPRSPFLGRWHIVSMSNWDEDYVNEEVRAFIEFEPTQRGGRSISATSGAASTIGMSCGMGSPPSNSPGTGTTRWTRPRAEAGPSWMATGSGG